MDVVDAVHSRSSIRQFLPDPVGDDVLRSLQLLEGSNLIGTILNKARS